MVLYRNSGFVVVAGKRVEFVIDSFNITMALDHSGSIVATSCSRRLVACRYVSMVSVPMTGRAHAHPSKIEMARYAKYSRTSRIKTSPGTNSSFFKLVATEGCIACIIQPWIAAGHQDQPGANAIRN